MIGSPKEESDKKEAKTEVKTEVVSEENTKETEVKVRTDITAEDIKEQIESVPKEETIIIPPIGPREVRALNRNNYEKVSQNFDRLFLIQNKKTQQIVELRAASSVHACNLIGWRSKNVTVLEEKSTDKEVKPSSVREIVTDQVGKFRNAVTAASSSKAPPADMLSG